MQHLNQQVLQSLTCDATVAVNAAEPSCPPTQVARPRITIGAALVAVGLVALVAAPAFAAKSSTASVTSAPGVTVTTIALPGTAALAQVTPPGGGPSPSAPEAPTGQATQSFTAAVAAKAVPPANLVFDGASASGNAQLSAIAAAPALGVAAPASSAEINAQGSWTNSKVIDWPAGTTVNDVLTSFGFPGAVPTGTSSTARPTDGVVRLAVVASNPVDPLAVQAREALDALLARHAGGAPPLLVSTDAIESAFKAQLPSTTAEPNAELRYAKARAELAMSISARMKVSPVDLDQAWGRTDERRMVAVLAALTQVGTLYQWAGNKPGGFDCSGLTSYAWSVAGVKIPRTSTQQLDAMVPKDLSQLQVGDLLWRPGHIGLYLGAGDAMVHSPQTGKPVQVRSYGKIVRVGTFV